MDEALACYERALEVSPGYAQAHNQLGLALAAQDKWPAALAHFQQAIQLKPDYAEALCNSAWLLATCRHGRYLQKLFLTQRY